MFLHIQIRNVKEIEYILKSISKNIESNVRRIVREEIENNIQANLNERVSEKFLTLVQASDLLCISQHTLRKWSQNRSIPCFKKNNRWYFEKHELIEWMNEGKRKTYTKILEELNKENLKI